LLLGRDDIKELQLHVMPDVTIIGAGPAGSAAAILLARRGCDVTLIEASRFPRDKVCGECLSAVGYDVLTRMGLAQVFRDLGAVELSQTAIHAASDRSLQLDLPAPMWGLSRRVLDNWLLDVARNAGAMVRQPARCEQIETTDGLCVRVRDLANNSVDTLHPSCVLLADGKACFAPDAPAPTGDFGIKAHFENVDGPRDTIELFGVRGSYGGLAAIEHDRWNAAFSVSASRLKQHHGDVESLFAEITSDNRTLVSRLAHVRRVGDWLAAPLPRFAVRRKWHDQVIPVGNAAAALEPVGGEGMGLAMRSAELAAEMLLSGKPDWARLRQSYTRLWRTRRFGCRAAAVAVSHRRLARLLIRPSVSMRATRAALRLVGKAP
jgi:flavin-dependent dehydrogenase